MPGLAKCCTCKHERTHSRHRATQLHVISFQLTAASRYLVQSQKHWAILIFKYNQQDATLHNLFISVKCVKCCEMLYMFQAVPPPIRSPKLYIQHRVLCQTFTATCHCRGRDGTAYSIGYFVKHLLLPATVVEDSCKGMTKYPMLYIQF